MTDVEKIDHCIAGVKRLHDEVDILRTALTWAKARISPKMEETHKIIDEALRFNEVAGLTPADWLVNRFASALKAKLHAAEQKYGYSDAWLKDDWREDLINNMAEHMMKGDPLDVAAYCAFAWHHGWSVAPDMNRDLTAEEQKMVDAAWERHKAAQPTRRPQDWVVTALDGFFAREGADMPTKLKGALVAQMALACTGIQGEVEVRPFEQLIMGE